MPHIKYDPSELRFPATIVRKSHDYDTIGGTHIRTENVYPMDSYRREKWYDDMPIEGLFRILVDYDCANTFSFWDANGENNYHCDPDTDDFKYYELEVTLHCYKFLFVYYWDYNPDGFGRNAHIAHVYCCDW